LIIFKTFHAIKVVFPINIERKSKFSFRVLAHKHSGDEIERFDWSTCL